jgi:hypothetical protein
VHTPALGLGVASMTHNFPTIGKKLGSSGLRYLVNVLLRQQVMALAGFHYSASRYQKLLKLATRHVTGCVNR